MTSPDYVNLNGELVPAAAARVSVFDHGLLYGDGLFETLRVYDGRFFRLDAHLARLFAGAAQLDLPLPWSARQLAEAIRETVAANGLSSASVRLTVTRGEGFPVPDPSVCSQPAYFVTTRSIPPPADVAFEQGASACFAGRHPRFIVPGVKLLCYLPYQQARQEARRRGCDEALLSADGELVEASTSNVFLVRGGELLTPPLESGCLPGVTRAAVLEAASALGIAVDAAPVPSAIVESAGELFLTSSLVELLPILRLGDRLVGDGRPGPLTRRLRSAFQRMVQAELG